MAVHPFGRRACSVRWRKALLRANAALGLAVVFVTVLSIGDSVAGPYEDAVAADREKDYAKALMLLRPLADEGDARAQYSLGLLYEHGRGVAPDDMEASEWYRKSAEQGYGRAEYKLGINYAHGAGVPVDYVRAYMWMSLAVKNLPTSDVGARAEARDVQELFATRMTQDQIKSAQNLASKWRPKQPN